MDWSSYQIQMGTFENVASIIGWKQYLAVESVWVPQFVTRLLGAVQNGFMGRV